MSQQWMNHIRDQHHTTQTGKKQSGSGELPSIATIKSMTEDPKFKASFIKRLIEPKGTRFELARRIGFKKAESYRLRGGGVQSAKMAKDLARLAKGKIGMVPMFPGEKHATQITLQNEVKPGGFIGPGTQIEKRLELMAQGRTDVLPNSLTDLVSAIHDVEYALSANSPDKKALLAKIRKADVDFLARLKIIKKLKLDNPQYLLGGERNWG